jgi:hypothetical protein
MVKPNEVAKSREQKLLRLFRTMSEEYGRNRPPWLWDYCQACVYGNNQQFTQVVNSVFAIEAYEPAIIWLSEIYGNNPNKPLKKKL